MPKQPFATNDTITAFKETKKLIAKAQNTEGSQFDYLMAVNHNIDVDNIKYTIMHTLG